MESGGASCLGVVGGAVGGAVLVAAALIGLMKVNACRSLQNGVESLEKSVNQATRAMEQGSSSLEVSVKNAEDSIKSFCRSIQTLDSGLQYLNPRIVRELPPALLAQAAAGSGMRRETENTSNIDAVNLSAASEVDLISENTTINNNSENSDQSAAWEMVENPENTTTATNNNDNNVNLGLFQEGEDVKADV